jgi:hypothetical protein
MKKHIIRSFTILCSATLLNSCSNSNPETTSKDSSRDTTKSQVINVVDTTKNQVVVPIEKKLNVRLETKLVEWGGDGKWHNSEGGKDNKYFINYSDPFKFILSGNYTDLNIKVKSSNGSTIFDKSGITLPENGEYTIENKKMIGETDATFTLEIKENDKLIYNAKVEGLPGGE